MSKEILRVCWSQSEEEEIAKWPVTPKGARTVEIETSEQVYTANLVNTEQQLGTRVTGQHNNIASSRHADLNACPR